MGLFKKGTVEGTADELVQDNQAEELDLFNQKLNIQIQEGEAGTSHSDTRKGFVIIEEDFGPLRELITNTTITDVDYNGTDLWLTDVNNRHWKATDEDIKVEGYGIEDVNPPFIRKLAQQIANANSVEFNPAHPVLEAETEELRIAVMDNSVAQSGTSMCIRKIPTVERITEINSIKNNYMTRPVMSLIANMVKAHMNIIVCGQPRAGKTELAKFVSKYIPDEERVITIEDVLEWHYKELNPTADTITMKANDDVTYSDCIVASLKQNPKWIMIAETRGPEVKDLITSFTTGVNGITTLHTDDVRKIPDRVVNMADDPRGSERIRNNVYEFVHAGILVSMRPTEDGGAERYIDQICFFTREDGQNSSTLVVDGGVPTERALKPLIERKFKNAYIDNIWQNDDVDNYLTEEGYDITKDVSFNIEKNKMDAATYNEMMENVSSFTSSESNMTLEEKMERLAEKKRKEVKDA